MKKTISLILGMFLLLTGCGKSSKLIRPTDSAETQETTWSGSEAKSEEEKKEEKKTDYMWYVRAAGYTAIAAGTIYLIYCVFDMCNKESIPPYKNNDPIPEEFHNQPQQENQFVQNEVPQQNQQQAVDMLSDTNIDESIPQENTEPQQKKVVETSEDIPNSDIHTSEPSQNESYVGPESNESDYSDTTVDEAIDRGDGVAFDMFNHAQKHGYPKNKLKAKKFKDIGIKNEESGRWRWASRSGRLVRDGKVTEYGPKVGWNDFSSESD
ncbi:hypothetical protein ATZ36_06570 [Candidatus Endomicrobiellum trichonymphae]|uniref:Lipoprotein n=1 Tax=Endomicrobium trichonymphae TaxID=1408204 RepID=A0A1E5IHP8_ENDTX|nr:hypothetical protein ATZ36_06570 [Candidatus Endomicrobium trichonymphae]